MNMHIIGITFCCCTCDRSQDDLDDDANTSAACKAASEVANRVKAVLSSISDDVDFSKEWLPSLGPVLLAMREEEKILKTTGYKSHVKQKGKYLNIHNEVEHKLALQRSLVGQRRGDATSHPSSHDHERKPSYENHNHNKEDDDYDDAVADDDVPMEVCIASCGVLQHMWTLNLWLVYQVDKWRPLLHVYSYTFLGPMCLVWVHVANMGSH